MDTSRIEHAFAAAEGSGARRAAMTFFAIGLGLGSPAEARTGGVAETVPAGTMCPVCDARPGERRKACIEARRRSVREAQHQVERRKIAAYKRHVEFATMQLR